MKLRRGWSGEISSGSWIKLDLELEQEDIDKVLSEADLKYSDLNMSELFVVIGAEVELLLMADALTHGANVSTQLQKAGRLKADSIFKVKKRIEEARDM